LVHEHSDQQPLALLLNKGTWAFRASCLSIIGAWISIGSSLLPAIIPVKNHPEWNLLLPKTAAPLSSLRPLVIVAILMIPVILIYSRIIYRIFQNPPREKRI
jgi:cytochrome bd-type quinol oxidase subunit 2